MNRYICETCLLIISLQSTVSICRNGFLVNFLIFIVAICSSCKEITNTYCIGKDLNDIGINLALFNSVNALRQFLSTDSSLLYEGWITLLVITTLHDSYTSVVSAALNRLCSRSLLTGFKGLLKADQHEFYPCVIKRQSRTFPLQGHFLLHLQRLWAKFKGHYVKTAEEISAVLHRDLLTVASPSQFVYVFIYAQKCSSF